MNSVVREMIIFLMSLLVISCNSNISNTSETQGSKNRASDGSAATYPQGLKRAGESEQNTKAASSVSNALQYQCRLPQGIKPTECVTVLSLAKSSSSVYDYLDLANESYKNAYYAANIDIIAIAKRILKSQSQEEICRLSIQSLKALDSVRTNFRDPYGYLEDVYDLFLLASQATKAESCLEGK